MASGHFSTLLWKSFPPPPPPAYQVLVKNIGTNPIAKPAFREKHWKREQKL